MVTLKLKGSRNSNSFARLLWANNLFDRTESGQAIFRSDLGLIEIQFSGYETLKIEDISFLALMIRYAAEHTVKVRLVWPTKPEISSIEIRLERLGFFDLFEPMQFEQDLFSQGDSRWLARVEINRRPLVRARRRRGLRSGYMHLRWIDRSDFDYEPVEDLFTVTPRLKAERERELRELLRKHGLARDALIGDAIVQTALELGWNTVLHSSEIPGNGVGVWGGSIRARDERGQRLERPRLSFCVADVGIGIPETLGHVYRTSVKDYHTKADSKERSGIVRFSVDPEGTSRSVFPSEWDVEGSRGLTLLASLLGRSGSLTIRSDGGRVRLLAQDNHITDILDDTFALEPLPGTQVVIDLASGEQAAIHFEEAPSTSISSSQIFPVYEPDGRICVFESAQSASAVARNIAFQRKNSSTSILLDLNFTDIGVRQFEYLCKSVLRLLPQIRVVFWNVRSPWAQLSHLAEWIKSQEAITLPPLVVRGPHDSRIIGVEATPRNDGDNLGQVELIGLDDYLEVARKCNSLYIARGFERGDAEVGFFQGRIHLLTGREVQHFFSLSTNVVNSESNLRRWVTSAEAGLLRVLGRLKTGARRPLLIGFAASVRNIMENIREMTGMISAAYILMPYDVPGRDEISRLISQGDDIILLTDVASEGSLLLAVTEVVRSVRANILGTVILVNAPKNRLSSSHVNEVVANTIICAEINTTHEDISDEAVTYWVDPVSLVPSEKSSWNQPLDTRVGTTIDLIVKSQSVILGHTVDGTRHASAFVRINTLLRNNDYAVRRLLHAEIAKRFAARHWSSFLPTIILYPSGVGRIEAFGNGQTTTEHQAAKLCSDLLQKMWPGSMRIEVPRAFEPGGRSRCATAVALPESIPAIRDVVIVDDGMWSGRTSHELARLSISMGAERILVVPLLARMSLGDLTYWESLSSITDDTSGLSVEICYVFPLFLPIPFFSATDCPYDRTISRLRAWTGQGDTVSEIATTLISRLDTEPISGYSEAFVRTWLRVRVLAELAAENLEALEQLAAIIESVGSSNEVESQRALFTVFLEEWHLLGRARLRQTIARRVRALALETIKSSSDPTLVTLASSLIRSLFRPDFSSILADLRKLILSDIELLERVAFHIYTLGPAYEGDPLVHQFLTAILDDGITLINQAGRLRPTELERYIRVFTICDVLQQIPVRRDGSNSPVSFAQEILAFYGEHSVRHDTQQMLKALATNTHLGGISARTFEMARQMWDKARQLIEQRLIPAVTELSRALTEAATPQGLLPSVDVEYLTAAADPRGPMRSDLGQISFALEGLMRSPTNRVLINGLEFSASRLHRHLIDERSTLRSVLHGLRSLSIRTVVDEALETLRARAQLANVSLMIKVEGSETVDGRAVVFAPSHVVSMCIRDIADNLLRYAFPPESKLPNPSVLLIVSQSSRNAYNDVNFSFRNNGEALTTTSARARSLRPPKGAVTAIQRFGGLLTAPIGLDDPDWSVDQTLTLLLW